MNYLNGQLFDMKTLCRKTHEIGAMFGVDLAHAAGNVVLQLHDWNVDSRGDCLQVPELGTRRISGIFVHENHLGRADIPRFEGWWGHDKTSRFKMPDTFAPMNTAEAAAQ